MTGVRSVGIVMNGVTGRMGTNQHLIRSIVAIREQGGIEVSPGLTLWPEPTLVGRNEAKLAVLAARHGLDRWTTDLDQALADPANEIYFDAQLTHVREPALRRAIAAGKHVYTEKPISEDLDVALDLARLAADAGIKNGVVQDKLFLPGLVKLKRLVDDGFFGRILSVRGEFGYWVFPGPDPRPQRPSWNYRAEDGGGVISDMFPHWRYVIDNIIGDVRSVLVHGATHLDRRFDESDDPYQATAEDAAYALFELDGGVVVQINSSWCVRVHRNELFELQVDGTEASAVAGLHDCVVQPAVSTPRSVWNPDLPDPIEHLKAWMPVPATAVIDNAFKLQWELFLRHVVADEPFPWDFLEAARGVQLAELGTQSWRERRWIDVPELTL